MTPDQLAKSGTEAAHQTALFAWAAVARLHGFEVAQQWAELGPRAFEGSPKIGVPALEWLHHIPNGGARADDEQTRKIRGGQLKAQGVREGVPDVFLPLPCYFVDSFGLLQGWAGLYIEMKRPSEKPKKEGSKGGLSDKQIEFGEYAKGVGYGWIVCYSWREAADAIRSYIEWGSK